MSADKSALPTPEEIAAFRAQFQTMTLATVNASGEPEASYAPYASDDFGNLYAFVSTLSRHTRNMQHTGRASVIFLEDEHACANLFARKRLVYRCFTHEVSRNAAEWRALMQSFDARFGTIMETLRSLADFGLMRFMPFDASYVIGFGQAYALTGPALSEVQHVDPSRARTSASNGLATPREILDVWFSERARPMWFNSSAEFDSEIRARFEATYQAGKRGELLEWERDVDGALALVLVFDQFPHHMYRRQPESFVMEAQSRAIARRIVWRELDRTLEPARQAFVYLPFMHSENIGDQEQSVQLFSQPGLENNLKWAMHHRDIVRRFNRFPHRNAILGRASSAAERDYLASQ
ncbi:MAG: DUF924 family protein [Gammaproteobacteria bacterium]|nr:DUF924 family protein [Gammaproteobacteria bacterium]